ncbi:hypothetical protein NP493_278g02024 [Ridgeia piscesae]|uniref:Protein BANP n=1 Tax=Ridgeia piscesae TaxID=27915 RepID=A0AAD9NXB2_RIDPI|nr:hypothetical protein NP493_278g02024 [Ridgeia piscesae]
MNSVPVQMSETDGNGLGGGDHSLTEAVQLSINAIEDEMDSTGEPSPKRLRTDDSELTVDQTQSIKQILFNINKAICLRLDAMENKLESVVLRTKYLEEKFDQLLLQLRPDGADSSFYKPGTPGSGGRRNSAVIVGLPQEREYHSNKSASTSPSSDHNIHSLGPNVTLITLNTEEDFPNGSWLGDENNPEMRVRVPITPSDMLHITSNCRTAEKMGLTLLDYLFDRDMQACSNLSGMGKHGKKQLDPLMIYGIRCHLIHRFGITETDWHRIKQNIDSKCRTAFRRKQRGLPLMVKAFRGKAPPTYIHVQQQMANQIRDQMRELDSMSDNSQQSSDDVLQIHQQGDMSMAGHNVLTATSAADIIQHSGGEIQVIHATPEQVAQLQQTHQIQILQGEQVVQIQPGEIQDGMQMAISLPSQHERIQVVRTDTGETIQITQQVEEVPLQQEVVPATTLQSDAIPTSDCEQSIVSQEVLSEFVLEQPQCQSTPNKK